MIKMDKELHNKLVDAFDDRAKEQQFKGKAYIKHQLEFFIGAIAVIDLMNGGETSCVSPRVYFSAIRGEKITKYED